MKFDLSGILARFWSEHSQNIYFFGRKFILIILIIAGAKIVSHIANKLLKKAFAGKSNNDDTLTSLLAAIIKYGMIIICIIMILDILGVNTAGLIAVLGTAGLAIGFALRDTLSNIAAGIILLILKPFRKGDFIECGSVSGTVKKVGLFSTNMETADGVFIFAPNSNFWGVPLRNFSRNSKRRMDITVNISYNDSIDTAFKILSEIIAEEKRFLKEPAAQVMVQSLGDTVSITLRAWASTNLYWSVYWDEMKNVKEKIQEANLTIAAPRRDIFLVK